MSIKALHEQSVRLKTLPHPEAALQQKEPEPTVGPDAKNLSAESPLQSAATAHNEQVGQAPQTSVRRGLNTSDDDFDLDSVLGQIESNASEYPNISDTDSDTTVIQDSSNTSQFDKIDIRVSEDAPMLGVIQVYKLKCLTCRHLVPAAAKEFNECHFSAGNKLCPASSMKIIQHIPIDKIIRAFKEAEGSGNLSRVSRLYAQVAKRPDWVQQRINDELRKARARKDW